MKVKKIAFGNTNESFIEDRINDGVNIIFSDDNNRGKTIVMQGLMYSLGYESIFPSSFNYKDQYFYSKVEIGGEDYEFLRKNNSFVVKSSGSIQVFNSERDFRYFLDGNILKLPRIIKDRKSKMVDFSLFYELFFIGQDNRSPSSLISKGQFNKADFKSMIFSIGGIIDSIESEEEIDALKERINSLKILLRTTKKKIGIIRANPEIAEITSKSFDNQAIQEKINSIKSINESISEIRRSRQREINRMSKLEALISELNSLNRRLSEGNVKCGECGSETIIYSNDDLTFEISNEKVRSNILESIQSNILQKREIIDEYTGDLNREQSKLAEEMETSPPNFQEIIVYQDSIVSEKDYDNEALGIASEIGALESDLDLKNSIVDVNKVSQNNFLNNILDEMMRIYKIIEPNGNLIFDDLFTKKDMTFSGSEEQEYYFSRIVALNNVLEHDFPVIVDSFRDGEISTQKEDKMIDIYRKLNKQVILTSTLKQEEYNAGKYRSDNNLNILDYSIHENFHIMQNKYSKDFREIVNSFDGIII